MAYNLAFYKTLNNKIGDELSDNDYSNLITSNMANFKSDYKIVYAEPPLNYPMAAYDTFYNADGSVYGYRKVEKARAYIILEKNSNGTIKTAKNLSEYLDGFGVNQVLFRAHWIFGESGGSLGSADHIAKLNGSVYKYKGNDIYIIQMYAHSVQNGLEYGKNGTIPYTEKGLYNKMNVGKGKNRAYWLKDKSRIPKNNQPGYYEFFSIRADAIKTLAGANRTISAIIGAVIRPTSTQSEISSGIPKHPSDPTLFNTNQTRGATEWAGGDVHSEQILLVRVPNAKDPKTFIDQGRWIMLYHTFYHY